MIVDCLDRRPWADVSWSVEAGDPLPAEWQVTVEFADYPPLTKTVSGETFTIRFWSDEFEFPTTYWPAAPGERLVFFGEIDAVGGTVTYDTTYLYQSIEPPAAGANGCPVYVED